jgi:hypothetical protein
MYPVYLICKLGSILLENDSCCEIRDRILKVKRQIDNLIYEIKKLNGKNKEQSNETTNS